MMQCPEHRTMSDTVNETKKNTDDILTLLRGAVADPKSGMVGVQTDHEMRLKALEQTKASAFQVALRIVLWFAAAFVAFLTGSKVGHI